MISLVFCRQRDQGGNFLLQNGSMNVQQPTCEDLAHTLPASWKAHDGDPPPHEWRESFWKMADEHYWDLVPKAFTRFYLVPLVGDQSITAASCNRQAVLTAAHLTHFGQEQQGIAELLAKAGCWCISDPRADIVSDLTFDLDVEPVTSALTAAASRKQMSLHQLVSEQHLGTATFTALRTLLTKLNIRSIPCQAHVRSFLRKCALFEDINGAQLTPSRLSTAKILPSRAWEQTVAALPDVFPLTVIKFHSTTSTQKTLLDMAGFEPIDLSTFLNEDVLPEVYSSASTDLQPLLLQALDSLTAAPKAQLTQPLQIFVNGRLHRISTLVDSSSKLMKDLFARGSGYAGYTLLPGECVH